MNSSSFDERPLTGSKLVIGLFLVATFRCVSFAQPVPYTPLTSDDRWEHYVKEGFLRPTVYAAALAAGAVSQLEDDVPDWHEGLKGYGKRTASTLARFTIRTTIHDGGSALLGYDPRYTRCQCSGAVKRFGHAMKWSFVTYNSEGKERFDFPALAGAYGGGMISMYWYPSRFNPLSDGVREGTRTMAFTLGYNAFKEFKPEIKRAFHMKP